MKKVYAMFALLVVAVIAIVWFSQTPKKNNASGQQTQNTQNVDDTAYGMGDYDSVDSAIVLARNLATKTITFRNLESGKQYTLGYTGASMLCDANGKSLSMEQIEPGLIVDVSFLKGSKHLNSLRESTSAFIFRDYSDYKISDSGMSIDIAGSKYHISDKLVVGSGLDLISLLDIHENDRITIRGFDREVYSICVDKGHGYLRLENDETFIGGWIDIGDTLIRPIKENMILTVPEGKYDVSVTNNGSGGIKTVTIGRGEEVTLDVADLVTEAKTGRVLFALSPSDAKVYIDGDKVNPEDVLTLTYGIHEVIFKAEGYKTLAKYVKVGQDMATLTITMEPEGQSAGTTPSAPSGTPTPMITIPPGMGGTNNLTLSPSIQALLTQFPSSDITPQAIPLPTGTATIGDVNVTAVPSAVPTPGADVADKYYVHIDSPEAVEVYVDGDYVGLSPVKFEKKAGTHEVILRKEGYQTRSYTIEVTDDQSDISYSFSELRQPTEG
ncbi:MAG: PEGA domain-containing protein [Lachnospiraceae bacterium]|nr:PEGA domain-containing protein [Candidatus Merdinaster equi]